MQYLEELETSVQNELNPYIWFTDAGFNAGPQSTPPQQTTTMQSDPQIQAVPTHPAAAELALTTPVVPATTSA